jgi:hypothetical protein
VIWNTLMATTWVASLMLQALCHDRSEATIKSANGTLRIVKRNERRLLVNAAERSVAEDTCKAPLVTWYEHHATARLPMFLYALRSSSGQDTPTPSSRGDCAYQSEITIRHSALQPRRCSTCLGDGDFDDFERLWEGRGSGSCGAGIEECSAEERVTGALRDGLGAALAAYFADAVTLPACFNVESVGSDDDNDDADDAAAADEEVADIFTDTADEQREG